MDVLKNLGTFESHLRISEAQNFRIWSRNTGTSNVRGSIKTSASSLVRTFVRISRRFLRIWSSNTGTCSCKTSAGDMCWCFIWGSDLVLNVCWRRFTRSLILYHNIWFWVSCQLRTFCNIQFLENTPDGCPDHRKVNEFICKRFQTSSGCVTCTLVSGCKIVVVLKKEPLRIVGCMRQRPLSSPQWVSP